ncbi:hypothetical protein RRG08_026190 [Elysia crispata]|uniref:G-protein coupled receptors family 1 profile domain-containing protein n=1 Tax=Elysia crispata TaxID=231223 RepID=A0AAE0ZC43_9GAST|nr:hypothetical protein RRG08_026190 [Elysia crispata]
MNATDFGDSSSSSSSSSFHSSLNDTWAYFLSLSNKEKLQLMEQLRRLGISEDDLNFLYKHFGTEGDDLRYFHIPEFRAHKALMLWVPPILLLLGTLGNTCSFAVLRQKTMRQQSIYMYLCALAVFDSLVLYVGLLRLWLGEITGTDIRNMSPWVCKSTLMLGYTCSDVSVWLIVAVTVERYIVVCHPLRARAFCQQLRAKIIIAGTVLVFSFVNIHFLFSTSLVENLNIASEALPPESQDGETMTCGPLPGYGFLVNVVWPWVDAMLYGLGPFLFISVLNTVIIFKKEKKSKQETEPHNSNKFAEMSISPGVLSDTLSLLTE